MVAGVIHDVQHKLPERLAAGLALCIAIRNNPIPRGGIERFRQSDIAIKHRQPLFGKGGDLGSRNIGGEVSGRRASQRGEPGGVGREGRIWRSADATGCGARGKRQTSYDRPVW